MATELSIEEIAALKRVSMGTVSYQGGIYTSEDAPDCLYGLSSSIVARVMGRLVGTYALAVDVGGTLELTDAGKDALASGFRSDS